MMNDAPTLPPVGVGGTPLVELRRITRGLPGRVAVKLETANPTGSVKDRVAAALVEEAEKSGALRPGGTIVAATSGNTGLALARAGVARGYKVRLVIPEQWSRDRVPLLLYLGADVLHTGGWTMPAAIARARREAATTPGAVLLDQFASEANVEVHRRTTAEEIWRESRGEVAAFVAGVGTGGTITGVALGLRARDPRVRIVAVEPAGSPVLSGGEPGPHAITGIGPGFVPPLLRRALLDDVMAVSDDDAVDRMGELAQEEGIVAGVSTGAAVAAALALAAQPSMRDRLIVTVAADAGERHVALSAGGGPSLAVTAFAPDA